MGHDEQVFLIRLSMPDRPGMLGSVASALGVAGADIQAVEIVDRDRGRVMDDFMVLIPDATMPDNVVSACMQVEGVELVWFSRYPAGTRLLADVEILERMIAEPECACDVLVDEAPKCFNAHWALVLDEDREAVCASEMAPTLTAAGIEQLGSLSSPHTAELPFGWVPDWVDTTVALTPLSSDRCLVLGRHGGPDFMPSELARLRYLATLVPDLC